MDDEFWQVQAKNVLRGEMMKRGVSHEWLVEGLASYGVAETVGNLRTKISRGRFSAGFFLQVLTVIGVGWLELPGAPGDPRGDEVVGPFGAQAHARARDGGGGPARGSRPRRRNRDAPAPGGGDPEGGGT